MIKILINEIKVIKDNNNGNKKKTKEKNSFLNTNYKQKNHQSKFNSIGKLISMNYPFMPNDKNRKAFSKNKNNINFNETKTEEPKKE